MAMSSLPPSNRFDMAVNLASLIRAQWKCETRVEGSRIDLRFEDGTNFVINATAAPKRCAVCEDAIYWDADSELYFHHRPVRNGEHEVVLLTTFDNGPDKEPDGD